jgi:hypothetical protein
MAVLAPLMTPAQIAQAQQEALTWWAAPKGAASTSLAQTAPAAAASSLPASAYSNNPASFYFWAKLDGQTIRAIGDSEKCGLVPKSAMPVVFAGIVDGLLDQVRTSYGDKEGNISFAGDAEFYQAGNDLVALAEQVQMAAPKPTAAECEMLRKTKLVNTVGETIKNFVF